MYVYDRVSKSCNHAITRLCKIFENLPKFWTNEAETGKTGNHFMLLTQLNRVFLRQIFNKCFSLIFFRAIP